MAQIKVSIDQDAQAAYLTVSERAVARTVEVSEFVLLDLDEFDVVVGIELLELDAGLLNDQSIPDLWHVPGDVWSALMKAMPSLQSRISSTRGEGGLAGTGSLSHA